MIDPLKIIVELSNPQNVAATSGTLDFIKDYIYPLLPTLLGSGIFGYVFWKRRRKQEEKIKAEVQKEVEAYKAELQKTANELSQTLSEKITRRSKAFDLQIKKEYEFYEKFGVYTGKVSSHITNVKNQLTYVMNAVSTKEEAIKALDDYNKLNDEITEFLMEYFQYCDSSITSKVNNLTKSLSNYRDESVNYINNILKDIPVNNLDLLFEYANNLSDCLGEIMSAIRNNMKKAII